MPRCPAAEPDSTDPTAMASHFQVPDGFVVDVIAAPPLVRFPMMGCLDGRGRLFFSESDGINRKHPELMETKPHAVIMLEDTDGDSRFDRRTVFADQMVLPNGGLWHEGAFYVASPPGIWKLEDTDADGRADRRTHLQAEFNFSGMSDSLHGPVLGPDGRLYWCGGQHGYRLTGNDGDAGFTTNAPGVFSCRLDGSEPRVQGLGGLANPVEVTFSREGDVFGTLAIHDHVGGRHDALLHWIRGAMFNLPERKLGGLARTGDFLPTLCRFGQVAPAGLVRYQGLQFGPEFQNDLFIAQFNTHKVVRVHVQRDGSTFRSQAEDFLVSPHTDTHFTDVIEDADGSLIVFHTGGWFRYGCPTSQIAKPEILGGIYRIRRASGPPVADGWGGRLEWNGVQPEELVARLMDSRPKVRERALEALVRQGERSLPALDEAVRSSTDEDVRVSGLWALCRIGSPLAKAIVRDALSDKSPAVRQVAARICGTLADRQATAAVTALLAADDAHLQRTAAETLGRIGDAGSVGPLLDCLAGSLEPFLEHALVYALIELNSPAETREGLTNRSPQVRRGALVALDQMPAGGLTPEEVIPLLDTDDVVLKKAAFAVISRREGWAGQVTGQLNAWLDRWSSDESQQSLVRGALLGFAGEPAVQQLMAGRLMDSSTSGGLRVLLLEVLARTDVPRPPAAWVTAIAGSIAGGDAATVAQGVAAAKRFAQVDFSGPLLEAAGRQDLPAPVRVAAIAGLAQGGQPLSDELFSLLVASSAGDASPVERWSAAQAIGLASLSEPQRETVCRLVASAGPLELPALVAPFQKGGSKEIGMVLLGGLQSSPGLASMPADQLTALLSGFPDEVRQAAQPLLQQAQNRSADQAARLEQLAASIHGGDSGRGREVFFGKKASCSACHRVGGEGGAVGPDLSRIGEIRTGRDLLESIVFPSASLARGYESLTVLTAEGHAHTGIIRHETPHAIVLNTQNRAELRLPRDSIESIAPSPISVMPEGLDRVLAADELGDLLAFLTSLAP